MSSHKVDVAVIGAGTAGLNAYRAAKKHANKVMMMDPGPYGTTCARVGCMPSKLLITAAEANHSLDNFKSFGLNLEGKVRVDGKAVMERVRRERDRFVGFVIEDMDEFPKEEFIRSKAYFKSPGVLEVEGLGEVEADRVVIASGTRTFIPPVFKNLKETLVTNEEIFYWEDLPESLAAIGQGVIGLELTQALHRLGVKVTSFGRSGRLRFFTDDALSDYACKTFSEEMEFLASAEIQSAEEINKNGKTFARLTYKPDRHSGESVTKDYEKVLVATGRIPNLDTLKIENSGLKLNPRGALDYHPKTLQCGDHPVFVAGDVSGDLALLHEASDEGRIAGTNAGRYPEVKEGLRRSEIWVAFTDPQMIRVGESFSAMDPSKVVIGEVSFENQGRSRVLLKNKGLLHVYADKATGRFLGAEGFGPHLEHIAHLLAWSHQSGLSIPEMLERPFYHPVIEEGLRTALRDARAKLDNS